MSFPVTINIIGKSIRLFNDYFENYPGSVEIGIMSVVNNLVYQELVVQKRMFERTTSTWRHKPVFVIKKPHREGGDVTGSVSTDDDIYFWLDQGTKVRYATMQKEFKPKTKPGRLRAEAGAFPDPAFVNKNVPRPGIEARHFSDRIYNARVNIYLNKARTMSRKIFRGFSGR